MSADLLRRAAALMRERAGAAQPATGGGGWIVDVDDAFAYNTEVYSGPLSKDSHDVATATDDGTATHIASWHPAVAVTVANLLEDIATGLDLGLQNTAIEPFAFAVARTYLGEDA